MVKPTCLIGWRGNTTPSGLGLWCIELFNHVSPSGLFNLNTGSTVSAENTNARKMLYLDRHFPDTKVVHRKKWQTLVIK